MGNGPYTTGEQATIQQYHNSYASPPIQQGVAINYPLGWATPIQPTPSPTEYPDAHRLATIPLRDEQPPADGSPEKYWRTRGAEKAHRYTDEHSNPSNRSMPRYTVNTELSATLDPKMFPQPEIRWTTKLNPSTYLFTRPFGQLNRTHGVDPATGTARYLNGMHFSMADHKRKYEILGMQPPSSRRNTYRLEPSPWDIDIVDMPPVREPDTIQARRSGFDMPSPRRSYRL